MRSSAAFALLCLLGAMLAVGAQADRVADRQACYERCMKRYGFKPVCVYSPKYKEPTPHLPNPRWVMPNACTVRCQMNYARYVEYFNLKTAGFATVPAACEKYVQQIYFNWSVDVPKCTTC